MNKVYLLFGLLSLVAIFAPDVRADISLPSEKITFVHTLHTHLFSEVYLSPESFSARPEVNVAQVCWITDTEDCGGADFVGTDGTTGTPPEILPPGGGGGDKSCVEMGFTKTSCPQPYLLNKQCPVNDKYYAECICPANYEECDEHYYGVGLACDGKYAECKCNTCEGYDYTESNIPKGYVKDKSCESCNGWKYTIKPNPCDGYKECANGPASGASSCLSGNKILYSDCQNCDSACPEGTTESNPGGCGGSTKNGCGDKTCYYPYKACCTDECPSYTLSSASSCSYGATSCYDSCYGKTWYKCNDAPIHTHSYSCPSGYQVSTCSSSQTLVGTTSKVCSCGATSGTCYKCESKAVWGQCTGYAANCEIGDIVFSDGTCNRNTVSGKTPIAVVAYKSGSCAIAIAKDSDYRRENWSTNYMDVPALKNMGLASDVVADWQGRNNTKVVLEYCTANWKTCPPFTYVSSYKTAGTSAGDWYLPSMGELKAISDNMDTLNTTLNNIGGTKISNFRYWSSCETGETSAWYYTLGNSAGLGYGIKTSVDAYTLPVIDFQGRGKYKKNGSVLNSTVSFFVAFYSTGTSFVGDGAPHK